MYFRVGNIEEKHGRKQILFISIRTEFGCSLVFDISVTLNDWGYPTPGG